MRPHRGNNGRVIEIFWANSILVLFAYLKIIYEFQECRSEEKGDWKVEKKEKEKEADNGILMDRSCQGETKCRNYLRE